MLKRGCNSKASVFGRHSRFNLRWMRTARSREPSPFRNACWINWPHARRLGRSHGLPEDFESTWLAPERLLLFLQFADGSDKQKPTATLDGQPLEFQAAYSSTRVDAPCFVGFYADVSKIEPEVRHTIELQMPQLRTGKLQGLFFDNVTPQLTESLAP